MSVTLKNYTYVHDVMRIWQGLEADQHEVHLSNRRGSCSLLPILRAGYCRGLDMISNACLHYTDLSQGSA